MLTIFFFQFLLSSFILPLSLLSILINIVLNSISYRLLVSISFSSFGGGRFLLYFYLDHVSLSLHSGCLSMCFCLLGRSAMSPGLGVMASCSRCLLGLSIVVSLITWTRCSRNVPCVGYMSYFVVADSRLLLGHPWVGLTFRLTEYED